MFRFNIGSIPVEVRGSHLLVAALLAWSWMPGAGAGGGAGNLAAGLPAIAAGTLVVFISILVHELGHALVATAYGFRPTIVLEYFGGHTSSNPTSPLTWGRELLLSFAGPFFGLCLGVAATFAMTALGVPLVDNLRQYGGGSFGHSVMVFLASLSAQPKDPIWFQMLGFFAAANLGWSVLNLIPVLPLDGGRMSQVLARRLFGRPGILVSEGLSLLICVAVAAWGMTTGSILLTLFFVMWGFRSVQVLTAYFRQGDPENQPHPADMAFAQAAALFGQQRFDDARNLAQGALFSNPEPPPPSRARLHHLLGWIALKEGQGETALDHFSRIGRNNVEPQALAAAFALSGDDERALSLFELAFRQQKDPAILSEWAGTLIRLGRPEEAARLPGVDLADAWRAAERLAYLRGDYARAAQLGSRALELYPSAELAYDSACSYARSGNLSEAQALLERAASLGFRDAGHALQDPDLAALRQTPAFSDWVRRVQDSPRS